MMNQFFFCVSLMSRLLKIVGRGYGVYHNFQQYFSYIVVVSFIGRGNRSTLRSRPQRPLPKRGIQYLNAILMFCYFYMLDQILFNKC
jgi:hypothetical protein